MFIPIILLMKVIRSSCAHRIVTFTMALLTQISLLLNAIGDILVNPFHILPEYIAINLLICACG